MASGVTARFLPQSRALGGAEVGSRTEKREEKEAELSSTF